MHHVCKESKQSFTFTDRDGKKRILFAFIILQKCNILLLLWVRMNKHRVLQTRKTHYFYLYNQKWLSILRASEHTGASICSAVSTTVQLLHTDTWTPHIPLDQHYIEWQVSNTYIFQMISWWMIDECLVVLYYHVDRPLTICPSRTAWLRLWIGGFSAKF